MSARVIGFAVDRSYDPWVILEDGSILTATGGLLSAREWRLADCPALTPEVIALLGVGNA